MNYKSEIIRNENELNADIFQYVKYNKSCDLIWYDLVICGNKFGFNEYELILFIVSCIRANYEINVLHTNICYNVINVSFSFAPVEILTNVDLYGLRIVWDGNTATIKMDEKPTLLLSQFELGAMIEAMYELLNLEYGKDRLFIQDLDPVYLEHMLGVDLPFIQSKEYIDVPIMSLRVFRKDNEDFVPINKHPYYLQLVNKNLHCDEQCITNRKFETNEFRYRQLIASIIVNGYPYKKNHIIIYNNDMIVRDGTHRLALLYKIYGDIKIPVMRINFSKNYYSYSMYKRYHNKEKCLR